MYPEMTINDVNALYEVQGEILENVIAAIKKYFEENAEMICAGLGFMNGSFYTPVVR